MFGSLLKYCSRYEHQSYTGTITVLSCSNKLCLVDPSTRRFHHVSKFVNRRDVVLLVRFLYDAKTSIGGQTSYVQRSKKNIYLKDGVGELSSKPSTTQNNCFYFALNSYRCGDERKFLQTRDARRNDARNLW